jgi:hypothetical protein
METHSKAVLSDDWGVGISLQWLSRRLRYKEVAHGRFAMNEFIRSGLAQHPTKGRRKRGPHKCPDFFAIDSQNNVHIIECKGNQQGPRQTETQFVRGLDQKSNVKFKHEPMVGQRLRSGVAIAGMDASWNSTLQIADPPPGSDDDGESKETSYFINVDNVKAIRPSMSKVSLIQGLLLAGAYNEAHKAFPRETDPGNEIVQAVGDGQSFHASGLRWKGRIQEALYPVPVRLVDETSIVGCRLRFGASSELLEMLGGDRLESLLASDDLAISYKENRFDVT